MTGRGADISDRPYTLDEADEACRRGGGRPGAAGPPRIVAEDAILLLLHADPSPMGGGDGRVRRAILAAAAALRGLGVEPALLRGERAARHAPRIDDAVEQLVFSNRVRMYGDRGNRDFAIGITERGSAAIREKYESLPAAAQAELARIRAGPAAWPRPRTAALRGGARASSGAPLKSSLQTARGIGGQDGRRGAEEWPRDGRGTAAARRLEYAAHGNQLLEEGKYSEAYEAYKLAKGRGSPDADLDIAIAASLAKMDRHKDALRHCRAAIKADPAGYAGYTAMGHCLDGLGRYSEALSCHLRAARLDPARAAARKAASFSLFRLGRYEEALRHAESAASMEPKDPAAHMRVAACLSMLGRHEEAVARGRKAIRAAPGRVDSYFPLIISLLGLGRHGAALKWCDRAAEADALDPRPHHAWALALYELGRHEEALSRCQKSVDLDPSDPGIRGTMARMLRDAGRLPEALSNCEAIVSAEPGNVYALSNMGTVLAGMGRHEEAFACFGRALRLDPRQPSPRYNRAMSLQATGRLHMALKEYERVIALDPGHTGAHNNKGAVLYELGRGGEALAHFDRALELDPGNAVIHLNKALSLQPLGLRREALAHFDRALELDPGNADAHVGRASCLAELGLPDGKIGSYAGEALGLATAAAGGAGPGGAGRRGAAAQETTPGGGRAQRVKSLLSKDESKVLEFKSWPASQQGTSSGSGKIEGKIAKELCSFVNTEGGDLLIGVGDGGEAEGLAPGGGRLLRKERDEMQAWLTNVIVDYFGAEHDGRFDRDIVEVDGLDVLHCAVAASKDGPVVLRKRLEGKYYFFVRAGSSCRALDTKGMLEYVKTRWPGRASRPRPMRQSVGSLDALASAIQVLVESVMEMRENRKQAGASSHTPPRCQRRAPPGARVRELPTTPSRSTEKGTRTSRW